MNEQNLAGTGLPTTITQYLAQLRAALQGADAAMVQDFIRMTRITPAVRAAYATTGAADYHLHVTCRDLAAYNRFLDDHLLSLPAVKGAQTFLVLKTIKEEDGPG